MLGEQATPPSLDAGRLLASQDWAACFQSMVCTITKFTLPSGKLLVAKLFCGNWG